MLVAPTGHLGWEQRAHIQSDDQAHLVILSCVGNSQVPHFIRVLDGAGKVMMQRFRHVHKLSLDRPRLPRQVILHRLDEDMISIRQKNF